MNGIHSQSPNQNPIVRQQSWSSMLLKFFFDVGKNLSIAKKIGYGYAIAIGIAVLGTTIGVSAGGYYHQQFVKQRNLVQEQQDLLQELENSILNIQFHPNRLFAVVDNPISFEYEVGEFLSHMNHARAALVRLEEFVQNHPSYLTVPVTEFSVFQQKCEKILENYETNIHLIWEDIDPLNRQLDNLDAIQRQIIAIVSGRESQEIRLNFENVVQELSRITRAAKQQEKAALIGESRARLIGLGLILGTMVVAVAIAILLAFRTSRAIARPLETVTDVARNVTKDSNFDLRAPITTQDEVGILADSLNQLIEWTGKYTHELELSQQTLEHRVAERTRELQQTLQHLQTTQAQLIQTEKMSGLGQMVAGIAHEINNPVNFIHGNLIHVDRYAQDLLELIDCYQEQSLHNSPEVEEQIEDIDLDFIRVDMPEMLKSMRMGSDRIKEIVLSLRNFSRLDEAKMKDANIHTGIDNTLTILSNRLKQGVKVEKKYGDIPSIFCYPAQLNQVFMNLIANALDALFDAQIEAKQITIATEKIDSEYIGIKIRDNGPGIPEDLKEKLFDPFFTTKPIGKGTGLGLTICYKIIEKHKGEISIHSQPGEGTEFTISLPICVEED
ncbi:MAG: ATP-binding protein [Cyanobacteria bacterium P01_E01_bin.42]